jgi:Fur family ferric uptake transcriptional regulator
LIPSIIRDVRLGINDAIAEQGHRVTGARRALVDLVAAQEGHFTAADLLARAGAERLRVGRATVFRTLDLLTDIGALERLDLPSGEHAYVACAPQEHHHHVVCRSCGKSVGVEEGGLQRVVADIAKRSGFLIESHRLELYGLCPACREGSAA